MKLAITIGLPCAGKSEFCRFIQTKESYIIVNPDTLRKVLYGEIEVNPAAEPTIWASAQLMARHYLLLGQNVIIDATNITKEQRRVWVNMAKEYRITLDMYWINTSYSICSKINEERDLLPRKVIDSMSNRLEYPTHTEGNNVDIYVVTPDIKNREGGLFGSFRTKTH